MRKTLAHASVLSSIAALAACSDPECPEGRRKIGTVCVPERRADASVLCEAGECGQDAGVGQSSGSADGRTGASCRATPDGCSDVLNPACTGTVCDASAGCDGNPRDSCGIGSKLDGDGSACGTDECRSPAGPVSAAGVHVVCHDANGPDAGVTCSCDAEYGNCDGPLDPEPGCETNLASSAKNCGACGYACDGDLACKDGNCEQKVSRLVLGYATSCALLEPPDAQGAHSLLCWGSNANNLLRAGPEVQERTTPSEVPDVPRVRRIALGERHACALDDQSDDILCWGDNSLLQLGTARTDVMNTELIEASASISLRQVVDLGAGFDQTCARVGSAIWCWGAVWGAETPGEIPQRVPDIDDAAQVAMYQFRMCVRRTNGQGVCWGGNYEGIGERITDESGALLTDMTHVAVGYVFACALQSSGEVGCWGNNAQGQLGRTVAVGTHPYAKIAGLSGVIQIVAGDAFACALTRERVVYCWGDNENGVLAVNSALGLVSSPLPVVALDDVVDIAAGATHACARQRTGRVVCWGANESGQLGDGTAITPQAPVEVLLP